MTDSSSLIRIIQQVQPDEIYNLAAQSHVKVSFDVPEYTAEADAISTLRILEAVRILGMEQKTRIYQASTSELFGLVQEVPQKETTPFYPRSPYGVAKQYGFWITKNYRESYGMYAVNGILFNHESERRGETFVTRKITLAAARIAQGLQDKLYLGNLNSLRDWGYAKDYIECMWLILQHDVPEDFVIATGEYHTVREFAALAFDYLGIVIRWEGEGVNEKGIDTATGKVLVEVDPSYFRPSEVEQLLGDPTKARTLLGWNPTKTSFPELVKIMVEHDMKFVKKTTPKGIKNKLMDTHIIIMAGGVGSRFWPMSTPEYPKQFIDVMGCGKSLIQLTVERFLPICSIDNFWVVSNEQYKGIIKEQLPDLPDDHILSEPVARNTAPCIPYACWKIRKRYPEANIVVTPSDALVINTTEFQRVISKALDFTYKKDAIVTVSIKPSRPETGYGYICAETGDEEILKVEAFKEKPDLKTAQEYVAKENYFWNAGIFVWNIDTIVSAIRSFAPTLAEIMDKMAIDFYSTKERNTVNTLFLTCEKVSIDYAVMEKAENIYTISGEFGWSDLGSWGSLHTLLPQDKTGNAHIGPQVKLFNCKNCIVHTPKEQQVILEGLDGYIVAENNGSLLVCRLQEEQHIKNFVNT